MLASFCRKTETFYISVNVPNGAFVSFAILILTRTNEERRKSIKLSTLKDKIEKCIGTKAK